MKDFSFIEDFKCDLIGCIYHGRIIMIFSNFSFSLVNGYDGIKKKGQVMWQV
jgi:hypothetical protein